MSTRSNIMIQNEDGSVLSIYCHFDGYPGYMKKVLPNHFDTEEKVRNLIALGDLSYIDLTGHAHAYHRDMHRSFNPPSRLSSIDSDFDHQEFSYLFHDGIWYVNSYNNRDWKFLSSAEYYTV